MSTVFRKIKCIFFFLVFFILQAMLMLYSIGMFQLTFKGDEFKTGSVKTILIWNAPMRKEVRAFGFDENVFQKQKCQFDRCEIFTNRSARPMETYDAIIFNFNDEFFLNENDFPEPGSRRHHQRYVFFTQESPVALAKHYHFENYKNFFNWTMTYRMDSDIPVLYGRIIPEKFAPRTPEEVMRKRKNAPFLIHNNKTKTIAWMVSHCNTDSQRETYVKELGKYVNVDVYGGCGNLTCARDVLHHSDPQCYVMLQSSYKFYLSFENSLCPDYVTEKFFKIMDHDIVPVVYGGADYSQHAPPHSYIDASKFKPKDLAAYLKLLDSNDTLYSEYFWWKDYYRVESSVNDMSRHGFCDLCRKLHENTTELKFHFKMDSYWGLTNCKRPTLTYD